ncbi:MAG: hypothetical protein L0H63_09815, partial [Nitrococcus sp.]|nr:hypothetical protein [Nitrococcus sp.]
HKARVADDDPLQAQELFAVKRLGAGFTDSVAPALEAVLRRVFPLYRKAGPGILEQEKGGRARENVARDVGDDLPRVFWQIEADEAVKCLGAKDERAECRRARQVVLYPVACCGVRRRQPFFSMTLWRAPMAYKVRGNGTARP